MATKKPAGKAQKPDNTDSIIQQLFLSTIDRSPKDTGNWRRATIAAESITNPNRSQILDLYEDLLLDPFLRGIILKRISQVVNKKMLFRANGEDVPGMKAFLKSKAFKDVQRQIVWRKMFGLSGLEFVPGNSMSFNLIPRKHIKPEKKLISISQYDLNNGISYDGVPNIWVIGDPGDLGLLLVCGFITLLKKGAVSDWAQYIEIFGSPAIILKYKGYQTQAQKSAEKILKGIGNNMRMAIPEEMDLKFEDGKQANGDGKLHDAFRVACNEELSIAILGNSETTGHSKTGTGAKSETHARQQLEIIKDDMDDMVDLLNSEQFMAILKSYNLPVDGGEFEFDREVDISMLKEKKEIDLAWVNAGLPVSKKYIYETYAIPEPKDGDDLFTPMSGSAPDAPPEPPKPGRGKKPQPQALSAADISAMLDEKLKGIKDFFDPAR